MKQPQIDYTNLALTAKAEDIIELVEAAEKEHAYGLCVHPSYLQLARETLSTDSNVSLSTVIDFPDGMESIEIRQRMVAQAIEQGANSLDPVMPHHLIAAEDWAALERDYLTLQKEAGETFPFKWIIEANLYTPEQIEEISKRYAKWGLAVVKTSTGVRNQGPANTREIVQAIAKGILSSGNAQTGIKIAGGIKSLENIKVQYEYLREINFEPEKDRPIIFGASAGPAIHQEWLQNQA